MVNSTINPIVAQRLAPLLKYYSDTTTIEVRINKPNFITIDRRGVEKIEVEDVDLSLAKIESICQTLANINGLKFHADDTPKISCVLPQGHRFECLVGATTKTGVSLAIRCKHPFIPEWSNFGVGKKTQKYLIDAVRNNQNIIISGATNTGKTTLLNMLLKELPREKRVVAVEDTPELELDHFWDGQSLLASRDEHSQDGKITWRAIYDHLMRITPDNILFGEISTSNAFAALAALNSGVTGFICTIHAESPIQAIKRKFVQNIAWSGQKMSDIPEFLGEMVDLVIQIKRSDKGIRQITDIYQPKFQNYIMKDNMEA